jgi:hypothetical protein
MWIHMWGQVIGSAEPDVAEFVGLQKLMVSTDPSDKRRNLLEAMIQEVALPTSSSTDRKWALKMDSYFRYLEYVELQEARTNSRSAFRMSLAAIFIALVSLAVGWKGTADVRVVNQPAPLVFPIAPQIIAPSDSP